MSDAILLVDFGSTYTKVLAVDVNTGALLGRAQSLTTVETDITHGLYKARDSLFEITGLKETGIVRKYASSSAAGGLKLAAIGLVPSLTLEAARRAALGAGAKVIWSSGFELAPSGVRQLEQAGPDIVLLCGGTNGGDKNVIRHNARMLARSSIRAPIVVAGNEVVSEDVKDTLEQAGKAVIVTDNVLPEVNVLNVHAAQTVIRDVFVKHITNAKGLNRAQDYIGDIVMPTPKATLMAAELLADGTAAESGIGPLVIVEIGGATINIHSVSPNRQLDANTIQRGLPEARSKRTVEGDLGIRYNAATILDLIGPDALLDAARSMNPDTTMTADVLSNKVRHLSKEVWRVPESLDDDSVDFGLAKCAAGLAVTRHAGVMKTEFSLAQEVKVQYGKDLTQVRNIIGTGGVFKYGKWSRDLLLAGAYDRKMPESLKPIDPGCWIDSNYLLYGVGLLAGEFPDVGLRLAKSNLQKV